MFKTIIDIAKILLTKKKQALPVTPSANYPALSNMTQRIRNVKKELEGAPDTLRVVNFYEEQVPYNDGTGSYNLKKIDVVGGGEWFEYVYINNWFRRVTHIDISNGVIGDQTEYDRDDSRAPTLDAKLREVI